MTSPVWYIVYVGAQIGGVAGPLPYDMAECQIRAASHNEQVQKQIATGKDIQGNPVSEEARKIHFECEYHDARPLINYQSSK